MVEDEIRRGAGEAALGERSGVTPARSRSRVRGRVTLVAGPDGSGKSSLADALAEVLSATYPVRRYHHRFRVLPSSAASMRPTDRPHASVPYGVFLSLVKLAYLFVDYQLGWWLRVRPFVRDGGWVIMERGWPDLAVDPRRYRLRGIARAARLLARALPAPDTTLILLASDDVILSRKAELPPGELARQRRLWRREAVRTPGAHILDAASPASEVVARALIEIEAAARESAPELRPVARTRWIGLPPFRRPRWIVPARPGRSAETALHLFQPVTRSALATWIAARGVARVGLLVVLPAVDMPALPGRLDPLVPTGGSIAVSIGNAGHTAAVMLIDRSGDATAIVKVALDAAGRARLALEVAAIARYRPLLEAPLAAPTILESDLDLLVMEPVEWRPRARAWYLPVDLAIAMGRFYRSGGCAIADCGPSHGDFAPWNVFRSGERWVVLDWEDAREHAPAFSDPFHYIVQSHALLGHPTRREVVAGMDGQGWVGSAMRAYAIGAGLPMTGLRERLTEYLIATQADQRLDREDGIRGLRARQGLLSDLGHPGADLLGRR